MNKKEILHNALILPLTFGIVFAIAFCVFMKFNIAGLLPVPNDTAFAYHDSIDEDNKIGSASFGSTTLEVRENASYSSLAGALSVTEGSKSFGEIGCVYLKTTAMNAKDIKSAGKMEISLNSDSFSYKLIERKSFDNELEAISYAPEVSRSVVVYYQASSGVGLASEYNALVLEEVR